MRDINNQIEPQAAGPMTCREEEKYKFNENWMKDFWNITILYPPIYDPNDPNDKI